MRWGTGRWAKERASTSGAGNNILSLRRGEEGGQARGMLISKISKWEHWDLNPDQRVSAAGTILPDGEVVACKDLTESVAAIGRLKRNSK